MPAPKVFLRRFILHSALSRRSTGAGPQWRARRQRTRAHAEARAQRRRHVAQEIAAARAAAFVAERSGRVGAQPVASRFALWINALHGEAGQILHIVFPHWPQLLLRRRPVARPEFPEWTDVGAIVAQTRHGVKKKDHNILGYACSAAAR